jgi:ADP-ribose pyrophosphatase YjhB (NUDIX family)
MEPKWLARAREIQASAQTGLTFTKDAYDRERYERLRRPAAEMMAEHASVAPEIVEGLFAAQAGYATPKVDVRGAVFRDGKVLLVKERADPGRWTPAFHIYKMFFVCETVGGVPSPGLETEDVAFFGRDKLPALSVERVLDYQIERMFVHAESPELPTEFD